MKRKTAENLHEKAASFHHATAVLLRLIQRGVIEVRAILTSEERELIERTHAELGEALTQAYAEASGQE